MLIADQSINHDSTNDSMLNSRFLDLADSSIIHAKSLSFKIRTRTDDTCVETRRCSIISSVMILCMILCSIFGVFDHADFSVIHAESLSFTILTDTDDICVGKCFTSICVKV